jgi:hypothetical protein
MHRLFDFHVDKSKVGPPRSGPKGARACASCCFSREGALTVARRAQEYGELVTRTQSGLVAQPPAIMITSPEVHTGARGWCRLCRSVTRAARRPSNTCSRRSARARPPAPAPPPLRGPPTRRARAPSGQRVTRGSSRMMVPRRIFGTMRRAGASTTSLVRSSEVRARAAAAAPRPSATHPPHGRTGGIFNSGVAHCLASLVPWADLASRSQTENAGALSARSPATCSP